MALSFAAFNRFDRFTEHALVRFRPEWIGNLGHNVKREFAANDELAQKETNGAYKDLKMIGRIPVCLIG